MEEYALAVFRSASDAAAALRALSEQSLDATIQPTPRDLSRSCGLSVRFDWANADRVRAALRALFPEEDCCRFFVARGETGHHRFDPIG